MWMRKCHFYFIAATLSLLTFPCFMPRKHANYSMNSDAAAENRILKSMIACSPTAVWCHTADSLISPSQTHTHTHHLLFTPLPLSASVIPRAAHHKDSGALSPVTIWYPCNLLWGARRSLFKVVSVWRGAAVAALVVVVGSSVNRSANWVPWSPTSVR